jgi:hypothetical protein
MWVKFVLEQWFLELHRSELPLRQQVNAPIAAWFQLEQVQLVGPSNLRVRFSNSRRNSSFLKI